MKPFSTEELARLQLSQEESMQDECVFQNYTEGVLNAYGRASSPFSTGISTKCGYQPASESEAMGRGEVVIEDALLRLPLSLSKILTQTMRVVITKRFGEQLTAKELFEIIGKPKEGPSGIVLKLKRTTDTADVVQSVSPLNIAGLSLWYDLADETTIFQDNLKTIPSDFLGDPIQLIVDKSGNGRDATQPVLAKRPTFIPAVMNGKPSALFDGLDDWMAFPDVAVIPSTIFVVSQHIFGVAFASTMLGPSSGLQGLSYFLLSSNDFIYLAPFGSGTAGFIHIFSAEVYAPHISSFDISFTTSTGNLYLNNSNVDTFPVSTSSYIYGNLGGNGNGSNMMGGYISEVLVYNRVLSAQERGDIDKYLKNKWFPYLTDEFGNTLFDESGKNYLA